MIRMQQEAVNRVHEFQTRAREAAAYYDVPVSDIRDLPAPVESAAISADNTPIEAQSEIVPNQSPPHASDPLHGLLDGLNLDSETLLIIGLLFCFITSTPIMSFCSRLPTCFYKSSSPAGPRCLSAAL